MMKQKTANNMKYIITEEQNERIFDVIYNFINDMLTEDNITYQHGYIYDTDEKDENILDFYGDKYINNQQDDWYFEYIKKEYYESLGEGDLNDKKRWLDKSPILEVLDRDFKLKLDAFFSFLWKPIFEQWFKDKYPHLPVKTFLYS